MENFPPELDAQVTRANCRDVDEMAALEACWSHKKLPANALAETGALFVPLGIDGLTTVLADKDSCVLVCRKEEKLLGMLVASGSALTLEMWPHLPHLYAPHDPIWSEPFWYVKTVAVDPASTGKGVGKRLVRGIRAQAMAADRSAVLAGIAVEPANKRSLALFRGVLECKEMGRHRDEENQIVWGLFKSSALRSCF